MYTLIANQANFSKTPRKTSDIKYIVIHYTANNGDTARNNLKYYSSTALARPASAHFFVDDREVCCSVPVDRVAWHCGGKRQGPNGGSFFGKACNSNSIGIEMCSRWADGGGYYFTNEVLHNAAEFTAKQMRKFQIDIDHVIRHYDVTGKNCPAPMIDQKAWASFKKLVKYYYDEMRAKDMVYYETVESVPAGELRNTVQKLVDRGTIKGNGNGLHLSEDNVRLLVWLDREGLFK